MTMEISATILLLSTILTFTLTAQNSNTPFKNFFEKYGLDMQFIFYRTGNGVYDNGVNILLKNNNDYGISYKFTLIFRADTLEKHVDADGIMKRREVKTGSNNNLYYIPFDEGQSMTEVGITNIRIKKKE